MTRALLQQALEALKEADRLLDIYYDASPRVCETITAIREYLDKTKGQEHKPVYQLWRSTDMCNEFYSWDDVDKEEFDASKNHPTAKRILYLHPKGDE